MEMTTIFYMAVGVFGILGPLSIRAGVYIPKRMHVLNVIETDNSPTIHVMKNSYLQCDASQLTVSISPAVQGLNAVPDWQKGLISLRMDSSIDRSDRVEFEIFIDCNDASVHDLDYYQPLLGSTVVINFVSQGNVKVDTNSPCSEDSVLRYDVIENSHVGVLDNLLPNGESPGDGTQVVTELETDAMGHFAIQAPNMLSLIKTIDRESLGKNNLDFSINCSRVQGNAEMSSAHIVQVQVKVYDTDDNLPYSKSKKTTIIHMSDVKQQASKTIRLFDDDLVDVTQAVNYRVTTQDTHGIMRIVKTMFKKVAKTTLISTVLKAQSLENFVLPYEIKVIYEDLTYSRTGPRSSRPEKVLKTILIVNKADPPTKARREQRFFVDPAAAKYTLVGSLRKGDLAMPTNARWRIKHVVPYKHTGIINVTREGDIYIGNAAKLRSCYNDSASLSAKAVQYLGGHRVQEVQLALTISSESGTGIAKAPIPCDHGCSTSKDEATCISSCGYASRTGRCQWYGGALDMRSTQRTCGPNSLHCPDGICNELEKLDPSICPQDCNKDNATHSVEDFVPHNMNALTPHPPCPCSIQNDTCKCAPGLTASNQPSADTVIQNNSQLRVGDEPACNVTCRAGIAAAGLVMVVVVVVLAVLARLAWRRRKGSEPPALKHVGSSVSMAAIPSDYIMDDSREQRAHVIRSAPSPASNQWMSKMGLNHEIDEKWEFPRNHLILDDIIGEGEFGQVVRAEAKRMNGNADNTVVAIKMLKPDASGAEYQDLISEFHMLKEVDHPNVIKLLGVCTQKGPLYVIVEYCELGSLRSFLRSSKFKNKGGWDEKQRRLEDSSATTPGCRILSVRDFFSFAWQIAKGMEYLAGLKIVHRDLAARNVLVTKNLLAKISDFGLSRDVYEADTYLKMSKGRIPVKWMAPESLYAQIYTTKSDIWSYGIVLWEIATLGASPYPGIPPERLFPLLSTGYRMDRPDECPDEFYAIMQKCWKFAPEDRPSFCTLRNILDHLLQQKTEYLELSSDMIFSHDDSSQIQNETLRSSADPWGSTPGYANQGVAKSRYNNIHPSGHVVQQRSRDADGQWPAEEDSDSECPESSHLLSAANQEQGSVPKCRHLPGDADRFNSQQTSSRNGSRTKPRRAMVHENLLYA